jgi:hypothetical protein
MRALKTIGTVLLFLAICMVSGAQTVQEGKVKEYKGKNKKSSLSGVEVVITNASTTVSDRDGDFVLHFHTMKPGQKVKDWKACVRTWEQHDKDKGKKKTVPAQDYGQRDYSGETNEAFARMLSLE